MGGRSWVALLLSGPLLVLGLPPLTARAATQSDPMTYAYDELGRLEAAIDPDVTAFALTVCRFALLVPIIPGVIIPGIEAAWPWLFAGSVASAAGMVATWATGGTTEDKIVVSSTNAAPEVVFQRSPRVAVFADAYQLWYDVRESFAPEADVENGPSAGKPSKERP
jgi:YD repeat-containing protein